MKYNKAILESVKSIELEILKEIIRICEKYKLDYYAIGGTLLGAIRHNGFIPWDDDIDIAMRRKDYDKLVEVIEDELDEKYEFDFYNKNNKYCMPFAKVRKKGTVFLEFHQDGLDVPNGVFVDIFPLDNSLKGDGIIQKIQGETVRKIRTAIYYKLCYKPIIKNSTNIDKIKAILTKILLSLFTVSFLRTLQEKLMRMYNNRESQYIVNLASSYKYDRETFLLEKCFPTKKKKFEDIEINIPNDYDYVLSTVFGKDYMKLPPIEKRITHAPLKIEV